MKTMTGPIFCNTRSYSVLIEAHDGTMLVVPFNSCVVGVEFERYAKNGTLEIKDEATGPIIYMAPLLPNQEVEADGTRVYTTVGSVESVPTVPAHVPLDSAKPVLRGVPQMKSIYSPAELQVMTKAELSRVATQFNLKSEGSRNQLLSRILPIVYAKNKGA